MNPNRNHGRKVVALRMLATVSLTGATLILPAGALAADGSTPSSPHKVFVCKYVGTPDDERLKAGKNPISVDLHTIDEYKTFQGDVDTLVGARFADAQGRSFVLAVDRGQPEPLVSDCPGYVPSETPTPAPIETPTASPVVTPTASPVVTPTAAPSDTPTDSPSETPDETEPDATPTPNLAVIPTSAPGGTVNAVGGTPQVTPPATDTTSAMQAGHDGNVVPMLVLLAALTGVFAIAIPHARDRARRTR